MGQVKYQYFTPAKIPTSTSSPPQVCLNSRWVRSSINISLQLRYLPVQAHHPRCVSIDDGPGQVSIFHTSLDTYQYKLTTPGVSQ
ncbi:hypothetical protein DPMN_156295 [Dreissena polymorpha]|uniref:Uncharacterized protein n=1 Tax=Dreissena polymorpha TaxID=45954 RepID=A0A9D4FQG6_DREPO|nr:hypothetical protein DPMN_156295 [Dreissena polymorpha]